MNRFRYVFMGIISILAVIVMLVTDPDSGIVQSVPFGANAIASLLPLLKIFIVISILHISRKGLFDYIDLKEYFDKARTSSEGAGNALIGVGLAYVAIAICILAAISL